MAKDGGLGFFRASDEQKVRLSRRMILSGSAAVVGWAASRAALAEEKKKYPALEDPIPQPTAKDYVGNDTNKPWAQVGAGPSELGHRSPFVQLKRSLRRPTRNIYDESSFTDWRMAGANGMITPSDLCFERHHAGIPLIDPAKYKLLVHGMVERPMIFTLEDLKRLGAERRFVYWECQGNGGHRMIKGKVDPEITIGDTLRMSSACEWIGVPLRTIMEMVNVAQGATWGMAESYDAAGLGRSVDIDTLWNRAYLFYTQNGEPVRPENGYPIRFMVPGTEGNLNVKWVRRIKFSNQFFQTREDIRYGDPVRGGPYYQYSVQFGPRSHIITPSGGMQLTYTGPMEIRGMAYSGYGKVARVEVSTDGGETWQNARLHGPVLPQMATMFTLPWNWDGKETKLKSRAVDETGHRQPTHEWLAKHSPQGASYNAIQTWHVHSNGSITHAAG